MRVSGDFIKKMRWEMRPAKGTWDGPATRSGSRRLASGTLVRRFLWGNLDEIDPCGLHRNGAFILCAWAGATTTYKTERDEAGDDSESATEAESREGTDDADDSGSGKR